MRHIAVNMNAFVHRIMSLGMTLTFIFTLWWLPSFVASSVSLSSVCQQGAPSIHEYRLVSLEGGEEISLSSYKGKILIIVNVASFCDFTVQYLDFNLLKQIGELHNKIEVIAIPSNQFGLQEPGVGEEILNSLKYVRPGRGFEPDFDMFTKCDVNGANEIPLYTALKVRNNTVL